MPINVHVGTPVDFCGDSLTQQGWFSDAASLVGGNDLLVDQLSPVTVEPRIATATGIVATATGIAGAVDDTTGGGQIWAIQQGHSQKQISDCLANIDEWIIDLAPDVLVLEFGRNDVAPPLPPFIPTTLVDFRASYDAVLDQTLAALPSCAIVCLSILCDAEQWAAGPVWNNAFDPPPSAPGYTPSIAQFNQQIQESCEAHGGTYVDLRAPALAYEVAHNTPGPPGAATGILTFDGTHPNADGQKLMSDAVRPVFVFSP